jgi:glycosyltransferase involved in cell wall biosynthesis
MAIESVTVIVPHYNRPDLVHKALLSIRNQSVNATEVLLVDDLSTPENREKIAKLSKLATITTPPGKVGPAVARNFGAQHAKGEWLAFLDDDDLYLPNKLERQIDYLNAHPQVVALGGGMTMVTPDGAEHRWGGEGPPRKLRVADALCNTASMSQALMIRKDVFLGLGGFDPNLVHLEDFEFGIRLLASGNETHFLPEPLFIYHRGGREQLTRQWRKMYRAEMRILKMHSALVRQEFGPLGLIRLRARCRKKHGLWKGGLLGRSLWAAGRIADAIVGAHVDLPPLNVQA